MTGPGHVPFWISVIRISDCPAAPAQRRFRISDFVLRISIPYATGSTALSRWITTGSTSSARSISASVV